MNASKSPSRCAEWAREVGVDPAGTAPRSDVFVIVEHPLPWPSKLSDDPLLDWLERTALEAAGPGRLLRLQVVAVSRTQPVRRVIVFNSGSPPFSGYSRSEAVGSPEQLPGLVASLVMAEPAPVSLKKVTDVLVCTHGSRDTCCGSLGTRLWRDLEDGLEGIRVWRTSHTGGHRFAPNAITFPDGNHWGFLDAEVLRGVVNRSMSADVAAAHLRGCAAFSPKVQVADRAVLARRGWGWLGCTRAGEELSSHRVELTFESFDGERGGYLVGVEETRMMPVPDCGGDPANAAKFHPEFAISHLEVSTSERRRG